MCIHLNLMIFTKIIRGFIRIEQGNRCFENSELLISYITLSYRYNNKCQYAYRDAYYIIDIYCI
ncbi:hypothetical protein E7V50_16605 [Escherichia coli]|nr:hypothetical protein [Escherichia coli]